MDKSELVRVAQLCLAKLKKDDDATTITIIHDVSDLQVSTMCSLWSGMGHIYKVTLPNRSRDIVAVKHVAPPRKSSNTAGDRRKADSYQVEANFYEKLAPILISEHHLRLPRPLVVERNSGKNKNQVVICMSFVQTTAAASHVTTTVSEKHNAVLTWLATLHAAYWGNEAANGAVQECGLQQIGSYWHLDTRPDEHASMPERNWEGRLKRAARAIDWRLKRDPLQCIIHGDAKDANILHNNNKGVTLCDFQYCGKGPPTKDLAYYFFSSVGSLDEDASLQFYLDQLTQRLSSSSSDKVPTMEQLRDSLELAYCDYFRFMSGWGYWGSGVGGEKRVKGVLDRLDGGRDLGSEEAYEQAVLREYG